MRYVLAFLMLTIASSFAPTSARSQTLERLGLVNRPPVPQVTIIRSGAAEDAQDHADISPDTVLRTNDHGIVELYFSHLIQDRQNLALLPSSTLTIRRSLPSEPSTFGLQLEVGKMRWVGSGTQVTVMAGKQASITNFATVYIASYDPARHLAEIVGVEGGMSVSNVVVGGNVTLGKRQLTQVFDGHPPTKPRTLSEEEFQRYVRPFELMGQGKAESQAIGDPVLAGADVPDVDRAPARGHAPADDGPRERAPFFEQPINIVGSTDIAVPF
jgi:hypothetical protein